jgi:drug/metabolite transporter (DMT)-like permease
VDYSAIMALGAAASWTMAAVFGHRPASELGSLHFNRLRMLAAIVVLGGLLLVLGRPFTVKVDHLYLLTLSSLIGVVLGDFFLFAAMRRLGPRRTNVLFASNAPIAAILGWLILGEIVTGWTMVAVLVGFVGVVLAIVFGKRRDLAHVWEAVEPPLWIGVAFGVLAATGQAAGVLLVRPVMADGADPVMAGLIRVMIAAVMFWATYPFDRTQRAKPLLPSAKTMMFVGINGLFGLGVGAAMLLEALEFGTVAKVTILSATTPVLILPIVWFRTKMMPSWGAWAGAVLVVLCSALLVLDL